MLVPVSSETIFCSVTSNETTAASLLKMMLLMRIQIKRREYIKRPIICQDKIANSTNSRLPNLASCGSILCNKPTMAKIDLSIPHTAGEWAVGIAEKHNSDHDTISTLLGIMGITLPQLIRLEEISRDQYFYSHKDEREVLHELLDTGVRQLTSKELGGVHYLAWKLTKPDQTHFQTFFPDQVHSHPGLATLDRATHLELSKRNSMYLYRGKTSPVDSTAHLLGENSVIFKFVRSRVKF